MNQREFEAGYKFGVASTIDQKRGARDALNNQKKEPEKTKNHGKQR